MDKVKITIIEEAKKKEVKLTCPSCSTFLARYVDIQESKGRTRCHLCETVFDWELK